MSEVFKATVFLACIGNMVAFFNELINRMRDLQAQVKTFCGIFIFAINMFQIVSSVLLHIEALIFNFPSLPPRAVSQRTNSCSG
jgi:hypothetical protein